MPTLKESTQEAQTLPKSTVESLVHMDNGAAEALYNKGNNSITLKLYSQNLEISLDTFAGEIKLIGGGSTMTLSRKKPDAPVELEVNYYWCGHPRDGTIEQHMRLEGANWRRTYYKDLT